MYHNALLRAQNTDVPDSLFAQMFRRTQISDVPSDQMLIKVRCPHLGQMLSSSQMPLRAKRPSGRFNT
ncbi:hypothetical protein Bca4012_043343 [Brassica carinata]